ncbi:MAG TPA: aminotransferase class III-fold pyridoxal phosphate-dependent enzyme [Chloroflexota bacterium]
MTEGSALRALRQQVEHEYLARTPRSRQLHAEARRVLPAGDTRSGLLFPPYPTYIDAAQGTQLIDVDGNTLTDFTFNSTSLIHGHAHLAIVEAIQRQAARGTAWNAPNRNVLRLAELLCARVPSLDVVRFCNSGTEANMQAVKAARAFSGRDLILKMDGAYHGTYDGVELNMAEGRPVAASAGVPRTTGKNVLLARYNDAESAARLIYAYRDELAAVVVTPILTRPSLGVPSEGYLQALREITRETGVLLLFDEVISLRVAPGGAQARFGVVPDLTAIGKIIGGGLPVGGFGGRADVMRVFGDDGPTQVVHAGTFNGNPLTAAAGVAAMELLTPDAFARLDALGAYLHTRLQMLVERHQLGFEVTVAGSLASFDLPPAVRADPAQAAAGAELMRLLQLRLLTRGIKTYGLLVLSTVSTEAEIDGLIDELDAAFQVFHAAIQATIPALSRAVPQPV